MSKSKITKGTLPSSVQNTERGAELPKSLPEPEDEFVVKESLWNKLVRFAGRIPFSNDVLAAWYCSQDPLTPPHVKKTLIGVIAYFILPIDAIPDFIVGLGFTDDAAAIALVMSMMKKHITPAHKKKASDALNTLTAYKQPRDEKD